MNEEYQRLEQVAKKYFKSLGHISELLGMKRQALYTYQNRKGFGRLMIIKLSELGINPEYIQKGNGPMLLDKKNIETFGNVAEVTTVSDVMIPNLESMTLEQIREYYRRIKEDLPKVEKILKVLDE